MKRISMVFKAVVLLSFCVFSTALWAGYDAIPVSDGGWITGKISYGGAPPAIKKIPATTDKQVCGKHGAIPSEELVVAPDSGIQFAVVYLADIKAGKSLYNVPAPTLDQNGCRFQPHVLVAPVGKPMNVRNSDGILHNIHTTSLKNPPINIAQPGSVPEMTLGQFAIPELIKVNCDAHGWMSSWIWATNHPYAVVTNANGTFKIADIPGGKYRLEVWHEKLGKLSSEVTVAEGKETKLNLVFPAKSVAPKAGAGKK